MNGADPLTIASTSAAAQTTIIAYLSSIVQTYGNSYLYTPIVVAQAWAKGTSTGTIAIPAAGTASLGVDIKSASTAYWDFL